MDQNPWVPIEQIANGFLDFILILIIIAIVLFVILTIFAIYYVNSSKHGNATNNLKEVLNKTQWTRDLKCCIIKLFRKMEHSNLRFEEEEGQKKATTVDDNSRKSVADNLYPKKEKTEKKKKKSSSKKKHVKKIPFEKVWSIANNVAE
ncbi:MAG: hypothetical protein V1865_00780 [bacterium]